VSQILFISEIEVYQILHGEDRSIHILADRLFLRVNG